MSGRTTTTEKIPAHRIKLKRAYLPPPRMMERAFWSIGCGRAV